MKLDTLDKKEMIVKYGKFIVLGIILIIILFILKGCKSGYNDTEKAMITAASKYINDNHTLVNGSIYLEISKLGEIPGTEMCYKSSGVIVTRENNQLNYKPYLKCENYESKLVKNKNNFITLKGKEVVVLNKGEIYEEANYSLKEDAEVKIFGTVSIEPGIYTLTYNAYDDNKLMGTATRIVIVTESDKISTISGITNKDYPTITLIGDTNITLKTGERYVEPGYRAVDYTDGKISRSVKVEPQKIDTSREGGPYTINYTVTNSKGRTVTAKRTVTVVKQKANLNISLTSGQGEISNKAIIKVNISGSGYSHMILPNNNITYNNTYSYEVKYNSTYSFKIYDIYGNVYTKEIEINNIDSNPPTGTCEALVLGSATEVNVKANDDNGISGYNYILDDSETGFISETTYAVEKSSKKVEVKVKDLAGNESKLVCEVTERTDPLTRGTASIDPSIIDTNEYMILSARNDTLAFAKLVYSKNVAQSNDKKFSGACLSFSYYHAYLLYNGSQYEINAMTAEDADDYKYAGRFKEFKNDDPQIVLNKIYEEINAGRPVILHVNGNIEGTKRHYITVVGYKASVKSAYSLQASDLLILDSFDGQLERMDTTKSRFIISGYDTKRTTYGYQIYILR